MVRLTRLKIDRFRNVKPGTDLRFGPTFNVLLGKNATGKSTLLDLIAAVTGDDLSAYATEDAGFDLTWWLEKGEDQVEVRAARTPANMPGLPEHLREEKEFDDVWAIIVRKAGVEIGRLEVSGTRGTWRSRDQIERSLDVRAGLMSSRAVSRAIIAVLSSHMWVDGQLVRPTEGPTADLRAAYEMSTPGALIGRFDEALRSFESITRSSLQLGQGGASDLYDQWLPISFITAAVVQKSRPFLAFSFDELEPLREIPARLGFVSAELRPRLLLRSQEGEKTITRYQGLDCLFRRADGSEISHELLSFGQKRLFAFLWYVAVREEFPIVADELLNGLHHGWIELCFDRLRDHQSFLATQHPLLLDHIPVESADAIRTTFVRCSTERSPSGREQMVWRNFDEEEAERFFVAYRTGIQQVSEVLRTEGLW